MRHVIGCTSYSSQNQIRRGAHRAPAETERGVGARERPKPRSGQSPRLGGHMLRSRLLVGAGVMLALLSMATPAHAQITTGTVTGNVKDGQGGVIPGATVVLISETRGDAIGASRHQRKRRLRLPERHGGYLHRRDHARIVQDRAPGRRSPSAAATASAFRRSRSNRARSPKR